MRHVWTCHSLIDRCRQDDSLATEAPPKTLGDVTGCTGLESRCQRQPIELPDSTLADVPFTSPGGYTRGVTLPGLRRLLGSTLSRAPSGPSGQCASSHLLPTEGRGPENMDPVLGPTPKYAWPGRVWFPLDGACRARSGVASGVLMAHLGERAWQGVGWQCWWAVDDADNSPPGRCMS